MDRVQLCGKCDKVPSCTWGVFEDFAVLASRVQTDTCLHTYKSHFLQRVDTVLSCNGLNSDSLVELFQPVHSNFDQVFCDLLEVDSSHSENVPTLDGLS